MNDTTIPRLSKMRKARCSNCEHWERISLSDGKCLLESFESFSVGFLAIMKKNWDCENYCERAKMKKENEPYRIFYKCTCGEITPKIEVFKNSWVPPIFDTKKQWEVCGECGEDTKNWKQFTGRYVNEYQIKKSLFGKRKQLIKTYIQDRQGKTVNETP